MSQTARLRGYPRSVLDTSVPSPSPPSRGSRQKLVPLSPPQLLLALPSASVQSWTTSHHLHSGHPGPSTIFSYLGHCRGLLPGLHASAFAPLQSTSWRTIILKCKSEVVTLLKWSRVQSILPSSHGARSKVPSVACTVCSHPTPSTLTLVPSLTPPKHTGPSLSPEQPLHSPAVPSAPTEPPSLPSSPCSSIPSSLTIWTIARVHPTAHPGLLYYVLHSTADTLAVCSPLTCSSLVSLPRASAPQGQEVVVFTAPSPLPSHPWQELE